MLIRPIMLGLVVASLIVACGGGTADDAPRLLTSRQDLCAGAAPEYDDHGEHFATAIACPFLQHVDNITTYGNALRDSALFDGAGVRVGTMASECDGWAVGTDADGVTIIVRQATGAVVSHGMQHRGEVLSNVRTPLALPVVLR